MGKYSGKVLTAYIAPSGVRVCEGANPSGDPDIQKFFIVSGVSDYFGEPVNGMAPEITNMSGLVSAIVDECKQRNTTAKRIMVCSDCFGIDTKIEDDLGGSGLKSLTSGDFRAALQALNGGRESAPPDKVVTYVPWGVSTDDGKIKKVQSKSIGDKYTLKSLSSEFYKHGYEVIYISGATEVLMNLWQTEPASFDSQGKVIFDIDVQTKYIVFKKDVPVAVQSAANLNPAELLGRLLNFLRQEKRVTGRNPLVYLTGSAFTNTLFYNLVSGQLEAEGYRVYDLLGLSDIPEDYEDKISRGEMEPFMSADYTANIAMMMAGFSKQLISLTPRTELGDMFSKNSKSAAMFALFAATALFLVSGFMGGKRVVELVHMNNNPSDLSTLQNQIVTLNSRQQSLNATIQTLTQADTTVLELMKFIQTNQTERVHVVSLDTRDMLDPDMMVSVSPDAAAADTVTVDGQPVDSDVVSDSTDARSSGAVRENIVLRGYAKTGNEAVGYYNRLFNYGLSVDPVLNGVERYALPDGDEVYIFEIEIGGVYN